jgi:hypothetical protein
MLENVRHKINIMNKPLLQTFIEDHILLYQKSKILSLVMSNLNAFYLFIYCGLMTPVAQNYISRYGTTINE